MPLIKPEVQKILRDAGLAEPLRTQNSGGTISEELNAAGLSVPEVLEDLASIVKQSGNENLRLRALETVLKAHGALKDTTPPPPSFTIIIQPSSASSTSAQQQLPEGVNPILLPRPLLNQLNSNIEKEKSN